MYARLRAIGAGRLAPAAPPISRQSPSETARAAPAADKGAPTIRHQIGASSRRRPRPDTSTPTATTASVPTNSASEIMRARGRTAGRNPGSNAVSTSDV